MRTALVLGDAKCVWEDAERALEMFEPDAIAATNNMGIKWPGRVDYWCTLHVPKCKDWVGISAAIKQRVSAGLNRPQVWSHRANPGAGVDRFTGADWAGSTGALCVKVLRGEGFDRIVLAGVPMNREGGHFYDDAPWKSAHAYQNGWRRRLPEIASFVRSMSGWTQELLGAPTPEWLTDEGLQIGKPPESPAPSTHQE